MQPAPALAPALLALALSSPAPAAAFDPPCPVGTQVLGAIGRATVVAFTGPVFGERVCALAANLAFDGYRAGLAAGPGQAMIDAAVVPGTGAALTVAPDGALRLAPGQVPDANPDTLEVGPFVIAPGGAFATPAGQTDETPRVVLAYAGPRVLVLATTAVTLVDLTRILQDQPDLFGIGAPERAVVLASGAAATLAIHASTVTLGTPPATAQVVEIAPR